MRKIKVIADTTCDLDAIDLKMYDVDLIPLKVIFGDKTGCFSY